VVTGTLSGGSLRADGEAELLPSGRRVRVRGLQGHGRPLEVATPARRVAVNLAGLPTGQVVRGDMLVRPGQWAATATADCRLRCLAGAPAPLRGRGAYLVYAGAAESAARLQPLDAVEVRPGGDALVRLHLERPMVLDVFEPLVLRDSGRDETVGGGVVLDPFPLVAIRGTAARVRRTEELEAREAASRAGLPARVLAERGVVPLADLPRLAGLAPDRLPAAALGTGQAVNQIIRTRSLAWSPEVWNESRAAVLAAVTNLHAKDPAALGLPAVAARDAAGLGLTAGAEVVETLLAEGVLATEGPLVRLPGHGGRLDAQQQAVRARVEATLGAGAIAVLRAADLAEFGADRQMAALLVRLGLLIRLGPDRWMGTVAVEAAQRRLHTAFAEGRPFVAAEAKEVLATTRKTAIPLLEYFDRKGVTVRQGNTRRLVLAARD
jgi:selenocysteine-specific elongation factor